MFLDEARLSAQLSHSNCVQVFDIGVGDNAFFIVMEFVDGANLKAIIEHLKKHGRDFPVEGAVFIALELCKGLAYAHELTDQAGTALHIVHRDMSPPNVLITKNGEVKIVDFGLAKANSQLEKSEPGIIKGKFSYLSPEAAMGQEVDARTDVFAVGIILWELLAGQRLFLGETDFQTVKKVQAANVPPVASINKKVPQELERIISKSLARDPAQRYPTARALGAELSKFMFKYGVPVSTFDIAQLVQGAMKERQRKTPLVPSIIDKLIEEALLEFTSLTDDKAAPSAGQPIDVPVIKAPKPSTTPGAYVDVGSWIDEISGGRQADNHALHAAFPSGVTEGNLAALEDEEPSAPASPEPTRGPIARPSTPQSLPPSPSSSSRAPVPPMPPSAPSLGERRPNPATRVGVLVALVVVMAAGAAAWFTHLIPHRP
jgi:serine/threonine-protein kinase